MADGGLEESALGSQQASSSPSPFLAGLMSVLVALLNQRYAEPLQVLRTERRRLLRGAVFAAGVAFFSVMGMVALSFGVIVLFWNRDRLLAVGAVIGFYWLVAALFFWRWRVFVKQGSPFFNRR